MSHLHQGWTLHGQGRLNILKGDVILRPNVGRTETWKVEPVQRTWKPSCWEVATWFWWRPAPIFLATERGSSIIKLNVVRESYMVVSFYDVCGLWDLLFAISTWLEPGSRWHSRCCACHGAKGPFLVTVVESNRYQIPAYNRIYLVGPLWNCQSNHWNVWRIRRMWMHDFWRKCEMFLYQSLTVLRSDGCQLENAQEEKGKCEIKYFDPTEHRIETMCLACLA